MSRVTRMMAAGLAVLAVGLVGGWLLRSAAQDKQPAVKAGAADEARPDSPELAAVKKAGAEFAKAFDKGDAKAVAAFWTKQGEYAGGDEEPLQGREAIEKSYIEFFKKNPKAAIEVQVDSSRVLSPHTILTEGRVAVRVPDQKEPAQSRYSVLWVREDDGWKMASVQEWVPSPADLVTLKDLEWMIGDWVAKTDKAEVRLSYAWDEDKAYIKGRYTIKRGDKTASSGTQIIGVNPDGGLRSWVFDKSGTFGQSVWMPDGPRWVIEAAGTLPDGSEQTAVNILVPLGKDEFTWQSVEQTVAGTAIPDTPPLKVTRVKADK